VFDKPDSTLRLLTLSVLVARSSHLITVGLLFMNGVDDPSKLAQLRAAQPIMAASTSQDGILLSWFHFLRCSA
jgi:hypothetical protein